MDDYILGVTLIGMVMLTTVSILIASEIAIRFWEWSHWSAQR